MEVASRSAQLLKGVVEAPPGDARAAERQPVLEEEGAGAGEMMFFWLLIQ